MKEQNITASENSDAFLFFLQKYPFGECVFFEITISISYGRYKYVYF